MDGIEPGNRFQFYHDQVFDDKISAIGATYDNAIVFNGDFALALKRKTHVPKLDPETRFVCRLEQARSELPVYLNCSADDLVSDPIDIHKRFCEFCG